MKTRTRRLISEGLIAVLIFAPVVNAYADGRTQIAAAIGAEESKPAAPAPSTTSPAKPPPSSTSTTPAAESPANAAAETSSDSGLSQAQIWLGVGVAAFLAAVGGGGGGGGSSSPNSTSP